MTSLPAPVATPADPCCDADARAALDAPTAHVQSRTLKALADPNRLRLVSIVRAGPAEGTCVCDLTAPLGLGQPTVSHHLKILVDAGLLTRDKRGTWAYYSLVPGALEAVAARLLQV